MKSSRPPGGKLGKEFFGREIVAEFLQRTAFDCRAEIVFALVTGYGRETRILRAEDHIRVGVHTLGQVFVEDEAQDVVPELVRPHLPAKLVRDVPQLLLQLLHLFSRHRRSRIS